MRSPFDPKGKLWDEIQHAAATEHNPALKTELERIQQHYMSAYNAGDFQALHAVRMQAFDDMLKRLATTDTKAANALRAKITDFKSLFDKEMERALGPGQKWAKFRAEYSAAADDLAHAEAGNKFMGELANRVPTPGGAPSLTGAQLKLANAADELNPLGDFAHSPAARDAFETVRGEINAARAPYQLGPKQSPTAQNLNPTSRVLGRAIEAQKNQNRGVVSQLAAPGVTTALFGPAAGAAHLGVRHFTNQHAINIAERLIQLHTDPARAAQALAQANLPPQVKSAVMQQLQQYAQRGAAATGGAMVNQE